jgi:hypothetical protein
MVTLIPQSQGTTNILFLDDNGMQVASLNVYVGNVGGTVKIHNHRQSLMGSTDYVCTSTGCRFTDQTHYQLPTQKNENHNYNYNYNR